jgi:hypothetical protein
MKIVGKFFAFIFSFIYCLLLTSFITISYSTNLLKGEFYTKILNKVDFNEINVKVTDSTSGELVEVPLKDLLVDGLKESGMDEETATNIVENDNIKRILGDVIGDVITYQIDKETVPEISKADIESIINDPELNKDNNKFTDEEIDEMYKSINTFLSELAKRGGFDNANTQ